ncbi:MAG: TIR domain-containing protein [Bacteroidota bacterium]
MVSSKANIFISYSRSDSAFVLELAKKLRASGAQIWLDQLDIRPGTAWDDSIEKALANSNTVLVVLSEASVTSKNVNDEYSYALEEEKRVVPVLLEACEIPFRLRRLQYTDFSEDRTVGMESLIKTLKLADTAPVASKKFSQPSSASGLKRKKAFYVTGGLIALASLFWVLTSVIAKEEAKQLTVLVHNEEGKDQLVLPSRGQVKLIYGDANVVETINTKGEATFKQIPPSFFEEDATVEILFTDPEGEPYRAVNPDSLYLLKNQKYIALAVKLFGLDKVIGVVKDFQSGDPLEGVRVSISGIEAYTNAYGEYSLSIPLDKQQKFQTIRANKAGYESFELNNVPIQTHNELPIALKTKAN